MANLWRLPEGDVDSLSGPLSGFVVSGPQGHGAGGCLWEGREGGGRMRTEAVHLGGESGPAGV